MTKLIRGPAGVVARVAFRKASNGTVFETNLMRNEITGNETLLSEKSAFPLPQMIGIDHEKALLQDEIVGLKEKLAMVTQQCEECERQLDIERANSEQVSFCPMAAYQSSLTS